MPSLGCGALGAVALLIPGIVFAVATTILDSSETNDAPNQIEGIDPVLMDAYARGPEILRTADYEQCIGMRWTVLAGIGAVESDHGAGLDIAPNGDTDPPFTGPRLDGSGAGGNTTPHYDTDQGQWDGDDTYDRAVGVTQHLPASWADYGVDASGSGEANPHNVYDSVASTAVELCDSAGGSPVDFSDRDQLADALYRYNPADWYVDDVLEQIDRYDSLPASAGNGTESGAGQQAVDWALDQLGKPYQWGGTGPDAFDCSGLTMRAWQEAGVTIPRVTTDQFDHGTRIPSEELQPGDLLFYNRGPGPMPGHVTMYIGDGNMINAPSTGKTIRTDPIDMDYYAEAFTGAVRPM